jgi:uncharacterized protein (DUF58 family)
MRVANGGRRTGWCPRACRVAGATALVWVVKLAVLGVLLYVAFWLALVMVCVMRGCWMARNIDLRTSELPDPELAKRTGRDPGLYTYDGFTH